MALLNVVVQDVSSGQLLAGANVQGNVNVSTSGWLASGAGNYPFSGDTNANGTFQTGTMPFSGFNEGSVNWTADGTVSAQGYQSTPFSNQFNNVSGDETLTVSLTPLPNSGGTGAGGAGSSNVNVMAYLPYIVIAITAIVVIVILIKYRKSVMGHAKKLASSVAKGAN